MRMLMVFYTAEELEHAWRNNVHAHTGGFVMTGNANGRRMRFGPGLEGVMELACIVNRSSVDRLRGSRWDVIIDAGPGHLARGLQEHEVAWNDRCWALDAWAAMRATLLR